MLKSLGYKRVSDELTTAQTLPQLFGGTLPAGRNRVAFLCCETQPVRFICHGEAPTISNGHLLAVGEKLWLECDLTKVKVIGTAAGAVLTMEIFKTG